MLSCHILLGCGALSLILYLTEKTRRYSVKGVLLKTLVSAFFVAVALYGWYTAAGGRGPSPLGIFVILGLLLGLTGDVWLDLKFVYPQQDGIYTYAGFTAFGIGHVLFIAGLLLRYARPGALWNVLSALGLALLLDLLTLALEKPMKLRYGRMRPVVAAYGFLLFSTVLVAGSLALFWGWQEKTLNLFFAGGVLFALSDLILSGTFFGEGKERPVDFILNYLTYYGGQFLIAYSLAWLS